jgi:hypothetical protein
MLDVGGLGPKSGRGESMMDSLYVLVVVMFGLALGGFAFTAGRNYEKRQERERWRAWYRSMKGQR